MSVASGNNRSPVPSPGRATGSASEREEATAHDVLGAIELELAQLLRRAERTRASGAPGTSRRDGTLDRSGYLLLHTLGTHGPLHVTALAERLGLDGSTVTRQVAALEHAGHVRRARDPRDGRAVVVEPTTSGLDELAAHRAARTAVYADVLGGWSRLDRALLAELLTRLNDDLDAYRHRRDAP